MRVIIQLPYGSHYKTRDKFIKEFNCTYAKDLEDNDVKHYAIFEGTGEDFLNIFVKLDDFFILGPDVWTIKEAKIFNSVFYDYNRIDYVVEGREIIQSAAYLS